MTQQNNKPLHTIRDGSLKATVWKNESEKGPWLSVDFSRGYRTRDGDWRDTSSFRGDDLLKLSFLAQKAYAYTLKYRDATRERNSFDEGGAVGEEAGQAGGVS